MKAYVYKRYERFLEAKRNAKKRGDLNRCLESMGLDTESDQINFKRKAYRFILEGESPNWWLAYDGRKELILSCGPP